MVRVWVSILDVEGDVNVYLKTVQNAYGVHIDVIDGKFVRGKKSGRNVWVKDVKKIHTSLHKHVHLMIRNPERYLAAFIAAGAGTISFHIEATKYPQKVIDLIRKKRKKVETKNEIEFCKKKSNKHEKENQPSRKMSRRGERTERS